MRFPWLGASGPTEVSVVSAAYAQHLICAYPRRYRTWRVDAELLSQNYALRDPENRSPPIGWAGRNAILLITLPQSNFLPNVDQLFNNQVTE